MPEPSVAARIVSELEQGAELVDVGGFDIDVAKALTKLAQFQLADARAYVLRLAEAGLLAGATGLRFDIRGSSLTVAFDRSPDPVIASLATLERLTSVLVSRGPVHADTLPRSVLVQLAVAALAITQLEPRYFAIESVAADRCGHRRVYAPEPKSELLADAEPGMRIYVVEGAELGIVLDNLSGQRREQVLLTQHCQFARTPIFINGRRISGQPVLRYPLLANPVVDAQAKVIGEAGFVAYDERSARVHLLSHGLLIESRILDGARPGFVAAIDLPLPRDLSQAAVAQSPELAAGLAAVLAVHARLEPWLAHAREQRDARKGPLSSLTLPKPLRLGLVTVGIMMTLLAGAAIEFEWPYEVAPAVSVLMGVIVFVLAWHPWRRKLR